MFYSYTFCWLMSGLSGAIGDAWEILANVVESVAILVRALKAPPIQDGTSDERGSVLVLLFGRAGSVLVVLLLRRAVLGTGVAAVSPVVTTVALEK
jgi:hypothetical protein